MGQKYSSQSSSGYNSSPPPDDGSTVAANKITWAGIKAKLADVLKTFIEAVNSQLLTALDYSTTTTSVSYTTVAGDHQKPIEATGTITISLGDATTMAAGYQVTVVNTGTGVVTVGVITATDDLDGTVNGTVKLSPKDSATFAVKSGATGYKTLARTNPYVHGADIASAATINLDTATGDLVDVTGTVTITAITLAEGKERTIRFTGILTFTNGASLVLPGGANITTAAGDYAIVRGYASSVVRCVSYTRANGVQITGTQSANTVFAGPASGAAAAPTFRALTAADGGPLVLLDTKTAANSATLDSTVLSAAYDEYEVHIVGLIPATDNTQLLLRFSIDGGSTYKAGATDYHFASLGVNEGGVSTNNNSAGATAIQIGSSNGISNTAASGGLNARITISNVNSTSATKTADWRGVHHNITNGTNITTGGGAGLLAALQTSAVNAIRFLMSSGNITSGTIYIYGVRKT
jgi:hypothetical protein